MLVQPDYNAQDETQAIKTETQTIIPKTHTKTHRRIQQNHIILHHS